MPIVSLHVVKRKFHAYFQKRPGRLADNSQYTDSANISPFIKQHVSPEEKLLFLERCNPQEHFAQSTMYRHGGNSQHQQWLWSPGIWRHFVWCIPTSSSEELSLHPQGRRNSSEKLVPIYQTRRNIGGESNLNINHRISNCALQVLLQCMRNLIPIIPNMTAGTDFNLVPATSHVFLWSLTHCYGLGCSW